jgi:hypothetical protein
MWDKCVQTSPDGCETETCYSADFCDRRALDFRAESLKNSQAFDEGRHEITVAREAPEFHSFVSRSSISMPEAIHISF